MTEQNITLENVDVKIKTADDGKIKDVISIAMKLDDGQTAHLEKNNEGTFKLTWRYHKNT